MVNRLDVPLVDGVSGAILMGSLVTMTEKHLDDFEVFWKSRLQQVEADDKFFEWAIYAILNGMSLVRRWWMSWICKVWDRSG
jgi:hypothetical protein